MPLIEAHLGDEKHLQDIADAIASSHKVIVVTGAGISTSIGIPDFRSKDGLYNLIPEYTLPSPPPSEPATPTKNQLVSPASTPSRKRKAEELEDEDLLPSSQSSSSSRRSSMTPTKKLRGQDLFDSRVFHNASSTTIFYRFIASLREKIYDQVKDTSGTHKFLRVLRDGGRLMRCYTQNIDGLEVREGLVTDLRRGRGNRRRFMKKNYEVPRPEYTAGTDYDGGCEVVQLHGELDTLRCSVCSTQWTWTENETEVFMDGFAPRCKKCARKSQERQLTGKRGLAVGYLRPSIVLYGEDHPQNTLLSPFVPFDAGCQPDVLVIMGTSLKVFGLQKIIREFAKAVHAQKKGKVIFINRTKPAESVWDNFIDYFVPMDCDDWVTDLRHRRSDIWLRQGEIDLKVKKPTANRKKRKSEDLPGIQQSPPKRQKNVHVIIPPHPSSPAKFHTPSTPRHLRENENLRQKVLSPLMRAQRPAVSPIPASFKPRTPMKIGIFTPGSPKRPLFSPITPQTMESSNLRKFVSSSEVVGLESHESDHEKENIAEDDASEGEPAIEDVITVTPSKPRFGNKIDQILNTGQENMVQQIAKPLSAFMEQIDRVFPRYIADRLTAQLKNPR